MLQDQITLKTRHRNFVKKISEKEIVYALKNNEGYATSSSNKVKDEEGNPIEIICFWSDISIAKSCIENEWNEYEISELSLSEFLENWCVGMSNDRLIIGTNFDKNLFGYEIEPLDLILEIISELNLLNKQIILNKFDGIQDLEFQIKNILEN
ncbi:DUF2750 domain-containing protein [Chryseobacterium nepalense]|uniref:DUF2750 domain-containing protein n=1 Tax=Chryseobacterium nepalense TaxID=1854498 RepID=A0ABY4K8C8_9FLAO|nr:DUF2750 domain-containing protein [Chryseobacterium nepalense]UPQ77031.1 DUF2750 domain-containing protein [Chryseobacterium nepalense]